MTSIESMISLAKEQRNRGDLAAAEAGYAEAAALASSEGSPRLKAHCLRHVAELAAELGDGDRALAAADESLAIYRSDSEEQQLNIANAHRVRALALGVLDRNEDSAQDWRSARGLYKELGIEAGVAECDRRLRAL